MGLNDRQFNDWNTLLFLRAFSGFVGSISVSILQKMPDCPLDYQLLYFDYFIPM